MSRPKATTFVLERTGVYSCHRCQRKLRAGERVTIVRVSRDLVEVRHAGRRCPVIPRVSRFGTL